MIPYITESDKRRFFGYVEKTKSCWQWVGATRSRNRSHNYGVIFLRTANNKTKYVSAHRMSLWINSVDIPDGMLVDHVCKNTKCVNPKHLRVVTPRQNSIENSVGLGAKNASKTSCKRGHEFDERNTARFKSSMASRQCRKCQNLRLKRWRRNNPDMYIKQQERKNQRRRLGLTK